MSCFEGKALRYGVFYPMQTFSKTKDVDFELIPVFIEGNSIETEDVIRSLANKLTQRVIRLSSADRKYLHLAAVWACNFTNYCYTVASDILSEHDIPFDVMLPLINETTEKIQHIGPKAAQTGPAVRGDKNVMSQQLELMSDRADLQELYKMLSKGHVTPALYGVLAERGFFPKEELKTFRALNSRLQGHPKHRRPPPGRGLQARARAPRELDEAGVHGVRRALHHCNVIGFPWR